MSSTDIGLSDGAMVLTLQVKELRAEVARLRELAAEMEAERYTVQSEKLDMLARAHAAESALASARELLNTIRSRLNVSHPESASDIDAWLVAHSLAAIMGSNATPPEG